MYRAAIEHTRTFHTWKFHHNEHLRQNPGRKITCRCDNQVGRFRKGQRRAGCGRTRCFTCHYEKLMDIPKVKYMNWPLYEKEVEW